MPRLRTLAAAIAAAALSSACYRVTVVTGAAPVATVVDRPWNNSFVNGLVPPPPVDVSRECAGGSVSRVTTQRSFLNGLVGSLTFGIYTPLQITAACGSGSRTSSLGLPPEFLGTTMAGASGAAPAAAPATTPVLAAPAARP